MLRVLGTVRTRPTLLTRSAILPNSTYKSQGPQLPGELMSHGTSLCCCREEGAGTGLRSKSPGVPGSAAALPLDGGNRRQPQGALPDGSQYWPQRQARMPAPPVLFICPQGPSTNGSQAANSIFAGTCMQDADTEGGVQGVVSSSLAVCLLRRGVCMGCAQPCGGGAPAAETPTLGQ